MEIIAKKLYGIKNRISLNFDRSAILFAPNGIGKTSLSKGLRASETKFLQNDVDGNEVLPSNLTLDGIPITETKGIKVLDSDDMNDILRDPLGIIKGFLKHNASETTAGYLYGNITKDFLIVYKKIKEKLDKNSIPFDEIPINTDNADGIDNINEILAKVKEISSKELKHLYEKYAEYNKLLNILTLSKTKDFKALNAKITGIEKTHYDDNLAKDYVLMNAINADKRSEVFAYMVNGTFKKISEVYEEIRELALKNGVSNEDFESLTALVKANEERSKSTITKTSSSQKSFLKSELEKIAEAIHHQEILQKREEFGRAEEEMRKNEESFLRKYNKYIEGINDEILKIDSLKWNIKINPISNYHEKTSVSTFLDGVKMEVHNFEDYASEGQKRIIAIILASIAFPGIKTLVLDDVVSSLDTDNLNIFKDILSRISETKNFFLLTHNYTLLSKLSLLKKIDFFVMEDIDDEKTVFKFQGKNSLFLTSLFKSETTSKNDKTLFAATVLREVVENYIKEGYPESEKMENIGSELLLFKADLEKYYRHFKTNGSSFKDASEWFCSRYRNIINLFDNPLMKALISNQSDDIISDYVLNFKIKSKFISLLDYIVKKYVFSMKVRFTFERNVYNSLSDSFRNKWDLNKILGIMSEKEVWEKISSEMINIFTNMFSDNHLNNLRWTPVIETPLYKMKMYYEKIKNTNRLLK